MSLASLPSASFPADLCQIYWCPTQGAQDHQPLAEPFRYPVSLGGEEGSVQGEEQETDRDVVQLCMDRQLSGEHTSFSTSGTLPALQTSHGEVISVPHKIITHLRKEVGGLGRGAASERRSVNSVQHTFIEYQIYAKPDAGDRASRNIQSG